MHGCQFPDAALAWADVAGRSGSAAEPAASGNDPVTAALSGEASGPQTPRLAHGWISDRAGSRLQSRIPTAVRKDGTGLVRHGRWPCATGLASYPSSCVCHSASRRSPRLRHPLRSELVARSAVATVLWWFRTAGSLRDGLFPLRVPAAAPKPSDGVLLFVRSPSGTGPPHWLTVATPVSSTDCVRIRRQKPCTTLRHSARGWFRARAPLVSSRRATHPLAASPSLSQSGKVRPSP